MVTEQPDKRSATSSKQSEFSLLCSQTSAVLFNLCYEDWRVYQWSDCSFQVNQHGQTASYTSIFDSFRIHQEQCHTVFFPCFSSGLAYLHNEGVSDASAREKKNLFEHNVQGFFSNSQLLGSGVVSHSWIKKVNKWIPLLLTTCLVRMVILNTTGTVHE